MNHQTRSGYVRSLWSQDNQLIDSSASESDCETFDVWSVSSDEDGYGLETDNTFEDLTSWALPMLGFNHFNILDGMFGIRRNLLNILMKGLLFAQEMYDQDWSLMETFHQKFPEKYDFLFRRGGPEDTIIFQGGNSIVVGPVFTSGEADRSMFH